MNVTGHIMVLVSCKQPLCFISIFCRIVEGGNSAVCLIKFRYSTFCYQETGLGLEVRSDFMCFAQRSATFKSNLWSKNSQELQLLNSLFLFETFLFWHS